ncbi:MAG: amino acid adenylation domain-containing protein [Deltaproteobacteria bacterium]|nr:amino acid adenylation domain-containing protein [Deltaproteobacteria bacterium]
MQDPPGPTPSDALPALLAAQRLARPDAPAVVSDDECVSWAQLDADTDAWADALRALGVGPEVPVGVCLPRSPSLVRAFFAVLKAGGVYLPLDPSLPRERLRAIASDARPLLTLADADTMGLVPDAVTARMDQEAPPRRAPAPRALRGDDAACVLYTSGSSGAPKGVVLEHRSLVAFARALPDRFSLASEDRVLLFTAIGFDPSLAELCMALSSGACLVTVPEALLKPGQELHRALASRAITHHATTPSALEALPEGGLPHLKTILCGGERLSPSLVRRLGLGGRLFNVYGPTEATVAATAGKAVDDGAEPSLGEPLGSNEVHLLGSDLLPVPAGVEAELFLGGPCVARGYLQRPDLTAERFVPDPSRPGARLYRTGDLALRRPDGGLVFRGRRDDQVKLQGVRVEPSEVTSVLARCPGVSQAAVVARSSPAGDLRLVAYVVPEGEPEPSRWRAFLTERLPAPMVPVVYVTLPSLPRTPGHKLDRRALPEPPWDPRPERPSEVPWSAVESALAACWEAILGARPGLDDDFFALGGDSLRAARMLAAAAPVLGKHLDTAAVYAHPTLGALARAFERAETAPAAPPAPDAPREDAPLLASQRRLWFLQRLHPRSRAWHCPVLFRVRGPLDVPSLEHALYALQARFEALRTVFPSSAGVPCQTLLPPRTVTLHAEAVEASDLTARVALHAEEPFDLERGPLWRAALFRLSATDHTLCFTAHHLVLDGASLRPLLAALVALYDGVELPPPAAMEPMDAAREEALLGDLSPLLQRCVERLRGAPQVLPFPRDHRRDPGVTAPGDSVPVVLPEGSSRALRELCNRVGVTPFVALSACFGAALASASGAREILLGTPSAGRESPSRWDSVGFFAGTLALRYRFPPEASLLQVLGLAREAVRDALETARVPFDRVVEALRPARSPTRHPLFQALFSLLDEAPAVVSREGARFTLEHALPPEAPFDLTLELHPEGEVFRGVLLYATDRYHRASAEALVGDYLRLLEGALDAPDAALRAHLTPPRAHARGSALAPWSGPETLGEALERAALAHPDGALWLYDGAQAPVCYGYRALWVGALELLQGLRERGLGVGARVVLQVSDRWDLLRAFWGCVLGGVVPTVVAIPPGYDAPSAVLDKLHDACARLGARVLAEPSRVDELRRDPGLAGVEVLSLEGLAVPGARPTPHWAEPSEPAFFQLSAGSSGASKVVPETHRAALAHCRSAIAHNGYAPGDVSLAWLPPDHVTTLLMCHVKDTVVGCTQVHLRTETFLADPTTLLALTEARRVTHTLLPNFAVKLLADALEGSPAGRWDLSSLRGIANGSEQVTPSVTEAFLAAAALQGLPPGVMRPGFGMAETASAVTLDLSFDIDGGVLHVRRDSLQGALTFEGEPSPDTVSLVCLGAPMPGVELRVVDPSGELLPECVVGALQVRGPSVFEGYLGDPPRGSPWFDTGDLGFLRRGRLVLTGRARETVVVRGAKVLLHEVDEAASTVRGVASSGVGACAVDDPSTGTEGVALFFVPRQGFSPESVARALASRVTARLGLAPVAVVPARELPRTTSGKLQRAELRRRFEARRERVELAPAAPPAVLRGPTRRLVAALWSELLKRPSVDPRASFFDLGAHSLLMLQASARLEKSLGRPVPVAELFRHPTVESLAGFLAPEEGASEASPEPPREASSEAVAVAIIGMALRLPGADTPEALWALLRDGVEGVRTLTEEELLAAGVPLSERRDPRYVPRRAVLPDVDLFDAGFFGMSPREAALSDPQQRLFLVCAHEALERAGYDPERVPGSVCVFGGVGLGGYFQHHVSRDPEALRSHNALAAVVGNDKDHLCLRVAWRLGLRGAAITVQTACSTSLVAVHLAAQEVASGRAELGLAGGANIGFPRGAGYLYQEGNILSPDGHCRAFDARGGGTVGGDGVVVVVLKRLDRALADGNFIHAVLLGSHVNNDGALKAGYTAPGVDGQTAVLREAYARAGVPLGSVGYIEAHGTGTALGDPLEVLALTRALEARGTPGSIALGSVKSNLGHLNAAAGAAGLAKAALCLQYRTLVPTLHYEVPNGALKLDQGPFYVNASCREFPRGGHPRRAGVSAFGFGGTNAHAVLQEAPAVVAPEPPDAPGVVLLSGRSPEAPRALASRVARWLEEDPTRPRSAAPFTLRVGRRALEHRAVWLYERASELPTVLQRAPDLTGEALTAPSVVFAFPGQGSEAPGMAAALHAAEPVFREDLERGLGRLPAELSSALRALLLGTASDGSALHETWLAQPALFLQEHALAALWRHRGVEPSGLVGHSVGELVAACVAGVFSYEDALGLAVKRGRLMQAAPEGGLLAVELSPEALSSELTPGLSLAAVNAPTACVVSGPVGPLEDLRRRLEAAGVPCVRLPGRRAFHGASMDDAAGAFAAAVARVLRRPAALGVWSTLTGERAVALEDPAHWGRQLRCTVRFSDALMVLSKEPSTVLLEVGPGHHLTRLALRHPALRGRAVCSSPAAGEGALRALAEATGRLWVLGARFSARAAFAGESPRRIPLPTYPLAPRRCWIDAAPSLEPSEPWPEALLTDLERSALETLGPTRLGDHPGVEATLKRYCTSLLVRWLRGQGLSLEPGAVWSRASLDLRVPVKPALKKLREALLGVLLEDGLLRRSGDALAVTDALAALPPPEALRSALEDGPVRLEGLLDLLEHCVGRYPEALSGAQDAIGVLYPDGTAAMLEGFDARTARLRADRVALALLRGAVGALASRRPAGVLRVLEVGGGQGILTWPLLDELSSTDYEYHFTDLGRSFVEDARAEAERRGLGGRFRASTLDLSRPLGPQGVAPGGFDLVVAYNVLHAVPDLRASLRALREALHPGGVLGLVEVVRTERWDTLTWGLAEGWWYYTDDLRDDSPLLGLATWERALTEEGYQGARGWPRDPEARRWVDHGMLLARRPDAEVPRMAPGESPVVTSVHPRPSLREGYLGPRTALETEVARLTAEVLGVERVGVRDPFTELGADSLIMLRLTDRIARELGREVPREAAFRGATVERLCQALQGDPGEGQVLVPIQPGGSLPPLFFVHPATGVVFPYYGLARELGPEQPFYGLQALGLDGLSPVDTRVEDMARHYVSALRAFQPRGPYHLGGFSFGCLVAYEMALQLATEGEPPGAVLLVDEPAPLEGYRPSAWLMARLFATGVWDGGLPFFGDYLSLLLDQAPSKDPSEGSALRWFLARSTLASFLPPEHRPLALRQPALLKLFELFLLHGRQTLEYVPRAYRHGVTLFKATELPGKAGRDPTQGWGLLAAGGVAVERIPGEHLTLLRPPHVGVLAARISAHLARWRA